MTAVSQVAGGASSVWLSPDASRELRQGELISDLVRYDYISETNLAIPTKIPFAIVFAQDCDLLQDFNSRLSGDSGSLDHVLIMGASPVDEAKAKSGLSTREFKPVLNNLMPRFQYLEACPSGVDLMANGFGAMVADFRSAIGMPTTEIYAQCSRGQASRRAALEMPYREHFQLRAAQFLSRVVLPEPHRH